MSVNQNESFLKIHFDWTLIRCICKKKKCHVLIHFNIILLDLILLCEIFGTKLKKALAF